MTSNSKQYYIRRVLENGIYEVLTVDDTEIAKMTMNELVSLAEKCKIHGLSKHGNVRCFEDGDSIARHYTTKHKLVGIPVQIERQGNTFALVEPKSLCKCANTRYVVPDYIETIQVGAFAHIRGLIDVEIPENVRYIGEYAFEDCVDLKSIILPDNIKFIKESTFSECISLASVKIPRGLQVIESCAFSECRSLSTIDFSESSLSKIGASAFSQCSNLKFIEFNHELPLIIREYAFYNCTNLCKVELPVDLKSIGTQVFGYNDTLKIVRYNGTSPKLLFNLMKQQPKTIYVFPNIRYDELRDSNKACVKQARDIGVVILMKDDYPDLQEQAENMIK